MRENRSADPWSAFLTSSRQGAGVRAPGAAPAGAPAGDAGGARSASEEAYRRVLAQLREAQGPLSLEQIHHATRLGLLEVADAVEALRGRGLVAVDREIDEVVRLTEG